jgi:AraC-like DNA-binding protein
MQDFASATMIRVIQAGIQRLGLPAVQPVQAKQAHVPLQDKRALVGQVLRTGGWSAVLQLGQGVHDIQDEPLIPLLVQAGQPWRVLDAWLRLERYLHSRHRVNQTRVSDCAVLHHHAGRDMSASPMAAESWLVLGVLAALLQRSGCKDVDANLPDGRALLRAGRVAATAQQLQDWAQAGSAHTWQLQWRVARHLSPEVTLNSPAATNVQDQMLRWIRDTHNWQTDVSELASALHLSRRSLQRKLAEQGTRFVDVMGQARVQRASHLLTQSTQALAEIGFATGYTDQAHFCRDFKRRTGLPPKSFRDAALGV